MAGLMPQFEHRSITQVKLYILFLNPVTANAEHGAAVALGPSERALKEFYDTERLSTPVSDGCYRYTFREGPLRLMNPLSDWAPLWEHPMGWRQGWCEEWILIAPGVSLGDAIRDGIELVGCSLEDVPIPVS